MANYDNSDIMTHAMNSFHRVISTRTSMAHSWLTIRKILQKLEYENNFIKSISVIDLKDVKEIEYYQIKHDIINVDPDIFNHIDQKKVGQAIQLFADELKKYLGKKAGYHLLREFRDDIGADYYSVIKKMGADLRLKELQDDLHGWLNDYDEIWN